MIDRKSGTLIKELDYDNSNHCSQCIQLWKEYFPVASSATENTLDKKQFMRDIHQFKESWGPPCGATIIALDQNTNTVMGVVGLKTFSYKSKTINTTNINNCNVIDDEDDNDNDNDNDNGDEGYIGHFFVQEKYRNRGLGTKLMQYLLSYGKNKFQLNKIYLCTAKDLKAANQMYIKFGFKKIDPFEIHDKLNDENIVNTLIYMEITL